MGGLVLTAANRGQPRALFSFRQYRFNFNWPFVLSLAIGTVACTSFQPVTTVVPGTIDVADEIRIAMLDGTEIRLTDPHVVDDTLFGRPRVASGGWSNDTVSIPVDGVAEILTSQPDRTKQTRFAIFVGVLSVVAALFLVTKVLDDFGPVLGGS